MAEGVDNPPEGADVQTTVPEWVPDKFRDNPEKFAESYTALERKLGEQGSKIGEYEQAYGELQQQVEQLTAAQAQPQQADQYDAMQEAFEADPIRTLQYILNERDKALMNQVQQTQTQQYQPAYQVQSQLLAAQADNVMTSSFDDWGQYKEKVADLIQERPYLLPEEKLNDLRGVQEALETAYEIVKAKDFREQVSTTPGVSPVDLARAAKQKAQTLAGAAGRPPAQDDDGSYWERIVNAPSGGYASDAA